MYELRYVSPKTTARVWGFLFALLYAILSLLSLVDGAGGLGIGVSIAAFLAGLVLVALFGTLLGFALTALYNFIAKKRGGMYLDFRLIEEDELADDEPEDDRETTVQVEPHQQ